MSRGDHIGKTRPEVHGVGVRVGVGVGEGWGARVGVRERRGLGS